MKLTHKQLQTLVQEVLAEKTYVVRKKKHKPEEHPKKDIDEAGSFFEKPEDSVNVTADVVGALTHTLNEMLNDADVTSNAYEMLINHVDDMHIPARHEDVDEFANEIADEVLSNPDLHQLIKDAAHDILTSLMSSEK